MICPQCGLPTPVLKSGSLGSLEPLERRGVCLKCYEANSPPPEPDLEEGQSSGYTLERAENFGAVESQPELPL